MLLVGRCGAEEGSICEMGKGCGGESEIQILAVVCLRISEVRMRLRAATKKKPSSTRGKYEAQHPRCASHPLRGFSIAEWGFWAGAF